MAETAAGAGLSTSREPGAPARGAETAFDDLTRLAAQLCGAPIALVSVVEADGQTVEHCLSWFGPDLDPQLHPASAATPFCAQTVLAGRLIVVPDARLDPLYAAHPLVAGVGGIRSYAGAPLIDEDGRVLGALAVLDTERRDLDDQRLGQLTTLAAQVTAQLTLRRRTAELAESRQQLDGVAALRLDHQRLTEAEQRWRSLVDHSPLAIGIISADGVYQYVNPRALEVYDVGSAAELVGRDAADFIAPGREDETRQVFVAVLSGETIQGWQWTLQQQTGRVIDVVISAARVTYAGAPAVMLQLRNSTEQATANRALHESERSWRTLFDASPVGIGLSNEHGKFVAANDALCTLLGRPQRAVLGRSAADFTHPDDLESHRNARRLIGEATDGIVRLEKRYLRPDGEVRWAWLTVAHTPGPTGEQWTLAHVQDVTDYKATERAIAASEANLRAVSDVTRHIQLGSDPRQAIVDALRDLASAAYVSLVEPDDQGAMLRVSATTSPELLGVATPWVEQSMTAQVFRTGSAMFLARPHGHPLVSASLMELTDAKSIYIVPVRSSDEVTAVLIVAWQEQVENLDDQRAAVVNLLADQAGVALRQSALVAELEALALTDPLTGLPNRRGWDLHLDHLMAMARRDGRPLTVALADLDHFKAFNDRHGHQAGDQMLLSFATAVRGAMRASDSMARWGGEEFAISLPHCTGVKAVAVLDRLRQLTPLDQTCSIGCATWDGVESAEQLIARVDAALYEAKHAGRNLVRRAEPARAARTV